MIIIIIYLKKKKVLKYSKLWVIWVKTSYIFRKNVREKGKPKEIKHEIVSLKK